MQELKQHEQFEMEVLKLLSDRQMLRPLVFGGGTCLRLCFGLNRYSVDLDFWVCGTVTAGFFTRLKKILEERYQVTDHHEKHFSLLAEIRSPRYPHKLKIEIRKALPPDAGTELNIAFSSFASAQVRLTTFTLPQMFHNKAEAFLERGEIRDAYDLEFMFMKDKAVASLLLAEQRSGILKGLDSFSPKDFNVKLGSLIEAGDRRYYTANGFKALRNGLIT